MKGLIGAALLLVGAGTAAQAEDRDFCADRPGKATPSCTLDAGKFQIETGAFDFQHSKDSEQVEDDYTTGDILLRYGLTGTTDLRAEWSGYGWARTKDRATGEVEHARGAGDVTLSVRQNFLHPEDKGTAIAVQPFVTLPVGKTPIGDGTWSAGILAPIGTDLTENWRLVVNPEVDAAADEDGHGRHLAYLLAAAVTRSIGKSLQLSGEGWVQRDRDPMGHQTLASIDFSAAWQPDDTSQFDLSTYVGATHATPRLELALGYSRRF